MGTPKLTVSLIPKPVWGQNFRNAEPALWKKIRKRVIQQALGRCAICKHKSESFLHTHEVWDYDDRHHILKLTGLQAVCHRCHDVIHLGRTGSVGGVKAIEQALIWLCQINGWTIPEGERHITKAYELWDWRSKSPWTVDISYGYEYLKEETA